MRYHVDMAWDRALGSDAESKKDREARIREKMDKGAVPLSPEKLARVKQINREIEALEAKTWTPELDKKHSALMKERDALGWKNPYIGGILRSMGLKR